MNPFLFKNAASMLCQIGLREVALAQARKYVQTDETSGELQLALLKRLGLVPASRVLEIGCGCLSAGIPIIQFLDESNYVGIEPNKWLIDIALNQSAVKKLVRHKKPKFLNVADFDASPLGTDFQFIISHSVLSHCAHWQLDQFLRNSAKVLSSDGLICASIRLAEGNQYGSRGSPDKEDSNCDKWQYPGVSFFKASTITQATRNVGLIAVHAPEFTAFYTSARPREFHDWFIFSYKAISTTQLLEGLIPGDR